MVVGAVGCWESEAPLSLSKSQPQESASHTTIEKVPIGYTPGIPEDTVSWSPSLSTKLALTTKKQYSAKYTLQKINPGVNNNVS